MKTSSDLIGKKFNHIRKNGNGDIVVNKSGIIVALSRQGDEAVIVEYDDNDSYSYQCAVLNINDVQIL